MTDRPFRNADGRPRIHIWREFGKTTWSIGPTGIRHPCPSAGSGVDQAIAEIGAGGKAGVVVIVEAEDR